MIVILFFLWMDDKLNLYLEGLFSQQGYYFIYAKEKGHKCHLCNPFMELIYLLSEKLHFILPFLPLDIFTKQVILW